MKGLTSEERRDLILSVGTHRTERRLSPVGVARLLAKAISSGSSRKQCGETLNISATQVTTFLKLLDLELEVQHLAGWGNAGGASISFSSIAELARLDPVAQNVAAEAILRDNLKWKEVIELVQIADRSGWGIDRCIEAVLKRRPEIEKRYVAIGKLQQAASRILLTQGQQEIEAIVKRGLTPMLGRVESFDLRLSNGFFAFVSNDDLVKASGMDLDKLEIEINSLIVGQG